MKIVTNVKALRKQCVHVDKRNKIDECVDALFEALAETGGGPERAGLAANQLGFKQRIIVMNVPTGLPVCIVNPAISKQRGTQLHMEQCLSLPGKNVMVKRLYQVKVKGLNRYLKPVKYQFGGLFARIVSHEIDHLDGKLITDYEGKEDGTGRKTAKA